ncbi:MAG TPA: zinc-binding dehydrogenase [Ilumatobacter sp.]|nr:zinc-binding dehydrogenase [Ilumatobacter sp.]
MKAVSYAGHGGPEVLELVDLSDPQPGPADVVVEVGACALNRLDIVQRNGWYTLPGYTLPHIAGMDIAGTVVDVGTDASGTVAIGDRVVVDPSLAGVTGDSKLAGMGDLHGALGVLGGTIAGGYAERCLVPASHVYRVPDDMDFAQAATFPTVFLTAAHALFATAGLTAGETVLIHAAGSGVSVAAIQLAVDAGATVLATAGSAAKLDRALELGATHVANNRTTDIAAWAREVTGGRGVDVVCDHVGTALWEASVFSLAIGGRLVSCGNTSGDTATIPSLGFLFHSGIKILGSDPYRPDEFGPLWDTFCERRFPQVVDAEFALADAAEAQRRLESNDVFGKIILRP